MDTLFSILHVTSAVFVVGPMAIMPMAAMRSLRHGDNERSIKSGRSVRLLSYLSLIVMVTGFGVMGMADPKYDLTITTPWVLGSLVFYVVAVLATLVVTVPALVHPGRQTANPAYARAAISSGLATLCLVAVVILMVWKP
ncbi:DUF2269 family protein [Microbacterium sp. EST19A]|uniref:DUF2269 family protein n=1 Tax=Microbacterium sp. EST19A TaxID=2862681 RepID=UPI001CBFA848|nr:DUF2269 family protein [Microbacterium sp. EST19A]